MSPFDREDGPPRPSAPVFVYNVPRKPVLAQLLGEFLGVWVHWRQISSHSWRARPCSAGECRECSKAARSGYGYAPAMLWEPAEQRVRRVVLSIPAANGDDFVPPHRGRCYELVHNRRGDLKPLTVTPRPDLAGVPAVPTFAVLPYVAQVLRVAPTDLATFDWASTVTPESDPADLAAAADAFRQFAGRAKPAEQPAMTLAQKTKFREWKQAVTEGKHDQAARLRREFEALATPPAVEEPPTNRPADDERPANVLPFVRPAKLPAASPPRREGGVG